MSLLLLLLLLVPSLVHAQARGVPHGGGSCRTDWDCSLGGVCAAGLCKCDPWFTNSSCNLLNLQPAVIGNGLDLRSQNYHSWGGHCVVDPSNSSLFHGFFSFMCRHATLGQWTTASSVIRATASQPQGPYTFQDMLVPPWSHNTIIAQDPPSGTYLIYHIGDGQVDPSYWAPCYEKNASDSHAAPSAPSPSPPAPNGDGIYVHYSTSKSPVGPWVAYNNNKSLPFNLSGWWATDISNPTPFFFPNGTVVLAVSASPCPSDWGALAPNCIGLLRADSWRGPYMPIGSLPIVHPESEDPMIFQDPRGNFHLLTNVNTYHRRCGSGVPCGGHAWSYDAITWSPQFIGAFGPVLRLANGTRVVNAYVERPQVYQDPRTRTPIAFFTGMGVSTYEDSISWAQAFCTADLDPELDCGPTTPDPPMKVQLVHLPTGMCAVTEPASAFPCPGGWANSCPLWLGECGANEAVWLLPGTVEEGDKVPFTLSSASLANTCFNLDCNSCVDNTVTKAIDCTVANTQLQWLPSAMGPEIGSLKIAECDSKCLNGGDSQALPPCKSGESYLPIGQLSLSECSDASAKDVWRLVKVA